MMVKWLKRLCLAAVVGGAGAMVATHSLPATAQSAAAQKGASISWNESFAAAKQKAARQNKILLLDFGATWCGPCQAMLHTTYKEPEVVERSRAFVPVLVDVDKSRDLAEKYKTDAIPVVLFLSPKGKVLARATGYQTKPQLLKLMDEAQKKAKS